MEQLQSYQEQLKDLGPLEILQWALVEFGTDNLTIASSMGVEDQFLTHLASKLETPCRLFFLDTGRHFQETYDCLQKSMDSYGVTYDIYGPEAGDIEKMVTENGPNLFYKSVELRKICCGIRKVKPLQRALTGKAAWVTGLRQEQSVTRVGLEPIEWDEAHGLYKINPLHDWSLERLWEVVRSEEVVIHALHEQGFPSIGCQPCTRAISAGEDLRAGRWWWEEPEHKECGLHNRPTK